MSDPVPPSAALRDGRYVLLTPLGEGGQGTTWDAIDKREGRAVAVKRFDVRGARAWKDVELAEREARVLASLSHPKLPKYIDRFEEGGALYLVMEKIEGTPLSVLRKRGGLREEEVLRLLRDADEVLAYLHGRSPPVVHRDLKPSNVIRRPDGSFAFVDFGAVRDRMRPEGGSTVVGTFGYMAPEQFQARAGPGSDVYAIGATAIALLAGEEPENLPHRGLAIDVEAALAGRASRAMREALARMVEPDPDRRPTRIAPLVADVASRSPSRSRDARSAPRARDAAPPPRRAEEWGRVGDLGRQLGREIRDRIEQEIRDELERAARKGDARAWRRAKRAERRAVRVARLQERRASVSVQLEPEGVPPAVLPFVLFALMVAQLAVLLAMRVVVPVVLTTLSVLFGRALREAAHDVSEAGGRAGEAIARARRALAAGGAPPSPGDEASPGVRGAPSDAREDPRVRVSGDADHGEAARDAVAEAEAEAAREEAAAEERERRRERG